MNFITNRTKNILIVEDQPYQAELLSQLIADLRPNYLIDDCLCDIQSSISYLQKKDPDLIFMDIELGDDLCFEIFNKVSFNAPVIYCTSHHEFALEAFYKNGIHFLTKPLTEARVRDGIEKFEQLENQLSNPDFKTNVEYQTNNKFLLNVGRFTVPIDKDTIKYAYLKEKVVYIVTITGKVYTSDKTLDDFISQLGSKKFFRLNRQFITHVDFIDKYSSLEGGRIEVRFKEHELDNQFVSFKKRNQFLNWMNE
ncbi:two component transcriptional regulator, LytTR family [Reichenbachiella faecimaris]|uniref:Two component transcriptional regulator, LytTR family n=1 Tax=Reichenbachiella faecimaris TaxID=692418 RepID=A0A1W2GIB0_REIFA|nr:LytTR family DNA-binding domain-containing protein [Reichenbachiella faecimaris]SMD36026.1 two component transcriptional regulator, LytTR family [Reichenbachiella faecimaris]